MRSRTYIVGFLASFLFLGAMNYYSYVRMGQGFCDDCFISFGFPFALWEEGGFVTVERVLWSGLVADVSITAWAGLFLGWVLAKVRARKLRTGVLYSTNDAA